MKRKATMRGVTAALALAAALLLGAPAAAWAVDAPADVRTVEQAQVWAHAYLEGDGLALAEAADAPGFELLQADGGTWELLAVTPDTSWYDAGAQEASLRTGSQLAGLAQLVNAGADFAGVTVTLAGDITFVNAELDPIGGPDAAFDGTFDGAGCTIRGYSISSTSDSSGRATCFGLFGNAGPHSLIRHVKVTGATVTVKRSAASSEHVACIGALVGKTAGSVQGCTVAATVDVRSDTPQSPTENMALRNVGGIAGCVAGDLTGCAFSGTVRTYTDTAGSSLVDEFNRDLGSIVAGNVGGLVGYFGDPDAHDAPGAGTHGEIGGCTFDGRVDVQSPSEAGLDRFGEKTSVKTPCVGGIAGYSQGSIRACTAEGDVYAPQTTLGGGIVGSLRCESVSGVGDTSTHDRGTADDWIVCEGCTVTDAASVECNHGGGGIAGGTGSYTLVTRCRNAAPVTVDRWNKPAGGGIVGQSHQNVTFCSNSGTVATATGGGFYCAGIVGMLLAYTEANGTPTTPTPEVSSCINIGHIDALAGMKAAGLVGQNDGYLHDCVVLQGVCIDAGNIFHVQDSSAGSIANCVSLSGADIKTTKATAPLNALLNGGAWDDYFLVDANVNKGYPILRSFAGLSAATPLPASATVTLAADAAYTGGEAVPRIDVSIGSTKLVQDADYFVLPQAGAVDLGDGYRASIVGIGAYSGTIEDACAYGIVKGDLAQTSVVIRSQKFDYKAKTVKADDVAVTDAYGNALPSSWYTYEFRTFTYTEANAQAGANAAALSAGNDEKVRAETLARLQTYVGKVLPMRYLGPTSSGTNQSVNAPEWSDGGVIHYGYYPVVLTATESAPYTGTVEAWFKVLPASLMSDCQIEGMVYGGKTYTWDTRKVYGSTFADGAPVIAYTGKKITPAVPKVTYLGRQLVEGVDYRVIYGNPNSDTDARDGTVYSNIGSDTTNSVACVTVRFIGGGRPYDFDNFVNMYFTIHGSKAPAVPDISKCKIVAENRVYTGSEQAPVKVYAADGTEVAPENYTVVYQDNREIGTASYKVVGTRAYTGTASGTFKILDPAIVRTFVDVDPAAWYMTSGVFDFALDSGLVRGIDSSHFRPTATLTRAQAAVILWRFAEPEAEAAYVDVMAATRNETGMADVKDGMWYTGAANWAVKTGVINGKAYPNGTVRFDPNGTITREQICTIVANYAKKIDGIDITDADGTAFEQMPDRGSVSDWARESVIWALANNVISGRLNAATGVRTISPAGAVQRCEMAAIMMNATNGEHPLIVPPSALLAVADDAEGDAPSADLAEVEETAGEAAAEGAAADDAADPGAAPEPDAVLPADAETEEEGA